MSILSKVVASSESGSGLSAGGTATVNDAAYDLQFFKHYGVNPFIDTEARTISEETDLLSIAQIFLNTESRRLPVLRSGRLVGQISRRDIMKAAHKIIAVAPGKETDLLYLSSIFDRNDAPIAQ